MTMTRDIAYRHSHDSGKLRCLVRGSTRPLSRERTEAVRKPAMTTASQQADFAVIGGGPGGLACAAALKVALGTRVHVKVRHATGR